MANGKTKVTNILVIDAHSHMGKDVDGHEMMNPMQAGQGTFDFWGRIEHLILKDWEDGKKSSTYSTVIEKVPTKISLEFVQMPILKNIFKDLQTKNKNGNYTDYWERIKYQNLIDQGVVFPFQDIFRDKKPEALYRASNTNVSRQVSKFPVSLRLNGYIRVHPDGLKLHPRSEGWLDKVTSQNSINNVIKAASYNWPVIFDTRGRQTILDIGELVSKTRIIIKKEFPHLLKNLKVIIAHAAAGNIDDFEVYNTIAQPNTYMDMSLCQGKTVERFFKGFREWCELHGVQQRTGRRWSEFCLYGSDYTYFQERHAKAFFDNIMYSSFFENGGNIQDIINILGLNQIKLFPEYGTKVKFSNNITPVSTIIQDSKILPLNHPKMPKEPVSVKQMMFQTVANLIDNGVMDIKQHLLQFDGDWSKFNNESCLVTQSKINPEKVIPLILLDLHDNAGLISAGNFEWKQMGFKYFDPDTRDMFHEMFKNSFPATNSEDAATMLTNAYK
ncbi:MAG: hypothetical protein ACTSPA_11880 [Promethearchaeota archaeon]